MDTYTQSIKLIDDFPLQTNCRIRIRGLWGVGGAGGGMIRDIYTTIATHNYPHYAYIVTMLATAEYSDIRCWPYHYCTILYIVLSLGHTYITYKFPSASYSQIWSLIRQFYGTSTCATRLPFCCSRAQTDLFVWLLKFFATSTRLILEKTNTRVMRLTR